MFETLCSAPPEAHNAPFGEAVRRAVFEAYKMTRKTKQSGDLVTETMTGMKSERITGGYLIARKQSMVNNGKKSTKLTN